jgi:multiple sugar transport system ATP-binding protein
MIAGLDDPTEGRILIDEKDVTFSPPRQRDIAMVFQNYALYPHMSVRKNMSFGLRLKKTPQAEITARVATAAKMLSIEELLERKPKELSGGQRQRVAIGRAIVREPSAFLFDEPLSNLDAKLRVQMRGELATLHENLNATSVYVTHDQVEAMTLANRMVVMRHGDIMQIGSPLEVYEQPINQFVAGFIGSPSMNFLEAWVEEKNSRLTVKGQRFEFGVPEALCERIRKAKNRNVLLGVRPEHIYDQGLKGDFPGAESIHVRIDVFEQLGSEVILRGRLGGDSILAVVDAHTTARLHENFELVVDANRLHLFDKATQSAY